MRQAVADARAPQFDLLLTENLDRLGRGLPGSPGLLIDLDRAGVAIATADGAVNTTRSADRLLLAILTAIAENEAAGQAAHRVECACRRRLRHARWAACPRLDECG
ncbi:recombinase family protein [Dactylosporangium sp. CA-092794]|uniref:recombinase family protein n=1 Tax=Dactylosporangium sp. CA-092794 TaxID=3239929 RepID=UPI003D8EF1A8